MLHKFIDACLARVSGGTRHLISPKLGGKDVMILFFFFSVLTKGDIQQQSRPMQVPWSHAAFAAPLPASDKY